MTAKEQEDQILNHFGFLAELKESHRFSSIRSILVEIFGATLKALFGP